MNVRNNDICSKNLAPIFALFLVLLLTAACLSSGSRQVIRISDGKTTSFRDMAGDVSTAEVIYVGEQHDNPAHHETQLDLIRVLHEKGGNLAIGLEMFKKEHQESLDAWISRALPEKSFIPIFLENWGFGWELYREIFLYAREKNIPLVGLNVPRHITRKVGATGFLSLTDDERATLPPNVTCELDEAYMDHLVKIFQYKKSTERSFIYFCEAQVLWDQSMAWYLTEYMNSSPGRTVIVLAGAIHAWKYGIPKHVERYTGGEQKVIVPDLPVGPESVTEEDADYLVLHS